MAFVSALDLRAYRPGEWVVLSALLYKCDDGARYAVPAGFITDLASIPRVFRGLFNQNGLSRRAAVLHDFLYCLQLMTRAEADALFLEALKAEGVGTATRYLMYAAVRSAGWLYWNQRADGINDGDFVSSSYIVSAVTESAGN